YKNEYWQNFALDFFWISCYELKKFVWFLLFNPGVLEGGKEIWLNRKKLRDKRREIKNKRRINWLDMRRKFYV
ncbi:TPA: hypothetical protein DEP86_03890, partial [Candidatus Uhrbacteria bacterium]|nr:hypothetical protein [Candidatus Uhrbacteria bacterium]